MELISDEAVIVERKQAIVSKYKKKLDEHRAFIIKNGIDPDEIEKWTWNT